MVGTCLNCRAVLSAEQSELREVSEVTGFRGRGEKESRLRARRLPLAAAGGQGQVPGGQGGGECRGPSVGWWGRAPGGGQWLDCGMCLKGGADKIFWRTRCGVGGDTQRWCLDFRRNH